MKFQDQNLTTQPDPSVSKQAVIADRCFQAPPRRYVDTPRTDAAHKGRADRYLGGTVDYPFAATLELQLNEARALLTRISDGAEPVLLAEEIEEFLDRTELP